MSNINIKDLKALVNTCRKLGIKTFKTAEYEFTLADHEPKPIVRRPKSSLKPKSELQQQLDELNDVIPGDMPSDESLLFWSAGTETTLNEAE